MGARLADGQTLGAQMGVLARKLARGRGGGADFGAGLQDAAPDLSAFGEEGAGVAAPSVDPHLRAWRLALARAARDQLKMTIGFSEVTTAQVSLTEVLETPMQRALILMLQGKGEGMGLMILSGQMLAAMVEMLTLTHLAPHLPDEGDLRKPTRTDAAMAVEFIDAALAGFEAVVAESGAENWAAGYRYAAFIEDPRPLHLMLEDGDYHLLAADLVLEDGTRSGKIHLALPVPPPALPQLDFGPIDFAADAGEAPLPEDDTFTDDLAAQVQDLPVQVEAALAQISLPIERIMRLAVGEVIALPLANLDQISLLGLDGFRVAGARLGQNRGMRALRLTDVALPRTGAAGGAPSAAEAALAQHLRAGAAPAPPSHGPEAASPAPSDMAMGEMAPDLAPNFDGASDLPLAQAG